MLTNEEIAMYLTYGFVAPVEYREPVDVQEIDFDEAKSIYRGHLEKAVDSYRYKKAAFACSGGISSASLLNFVDYPTTAIGLSGKWSKPQADFYGVKHVTCGVQDISFEEFEQNIINMHKLFDKPHNRPLNTLIYHRNKKVKELGYDHYVCEGGPPFLLPFISDHIIRPEDYDVSFAKEILKKGKYSKVAKGYDFSTGLRNRALPYASYFKKLRVFEDDILGDFGFEEPKIELKNDTLQDFRMAATDWFWPNTLTTFDYAKSFGVKMLSPYFTDSALWHFCLSMPIEMISCLGINNFILKEAIGSKLSPIDPTVKFEPHKRTHYKIKDKVMQLCVKYLDDPDAKIYDYLDYRLVSKLRKAENRLVEWQLTHLAIWLEVNM